MDNETRASYGEQAVDAGTPDRGQNDDKTDVVDTLANIMHYCRQQDITLDDVMETATMHFDWEIEGEG